MAAVMLGGAVGLVVATVLSVPVCLVWQRVMGVRNDSYEAFIPFLLFLWPAGMLVGVWTAYRIWQRRA